VAGNSWAISETWRRFAPGVMVLASRALGRPWDAEDVTQEVFQELFAKATILREPDRLRSFVFSFAVRGVKHARRRNRRRAWLSFDPSETLANVTADHVDMESRDLLRRFYALLDRLAPRHRLAFALRHLESMTLDEVAAHMDLSVATVKRALNRATSKLSRWIELDPGLAAFAATLHDGVAWRRRRTARERIRTG
jgi:RNA polymerase sigma-70 factor (ECF subfamily)